MLKSWWKSLSSKRKCVSTGALASMVLLVASGIWLLVSESFLAMAITMIAAVSCGCLGILGDDILPRREKEERYRALLAHCTAVYNVVFWREFYTALRSAPFQDEYQWEHARMVANTAAIRHVHVRLSELINRDLNVWLRLTNDLWECGERNLLLCLQELKWEAHKVLEEFEHSMANG